MLTHSRTLVVQWGDCDPAGIVYFPRYFEWFDDSTAALFEAAGLPKAALLARFQILGIPVVDVRSRFRKPSTFGDRVVIESGIPSWGTASFDVHHRLLRGGELAVEASERRVWAVRTPEGTIRSRPLPPEVLALFSGSPPKTV
jgi:4-hydroxybenzoyl-CoA thioesterase